MHASASWELHPPHPPAHTEEFLARGASPGHAGRSLQPLAKLQACKHQEMAPGFGHYTNGINIANFRIVSEHQQNKPNNHYRSTADWAAEVRCRRGHEQA